jgi:hypothetical protein
MHENDSIQMPALLALIDSARERIRRSHVEVSEIFDADFVFRHVDTFLSDDQVSALEKAMYLLLNQYAGDHHDYFVIPRERVRVPEVYELRPPGYNDYEIDFAVYSGSENRIIKIAVECDGIRSHRERHSDRDRHKDVNLQAAGWTVLRFGSREIHRELKALQETDHHINKFVTIIDNIVAAQSDTLTQGRYHQFAGRLTGYTYGPLTCAACRQPQWVALEIAKRCRLCGAPFGPRPHEVPR